MLPNSTSDMLSNAAMNTAPFEKQLMCNDIGQWHVREWGISHVLILTVPRFDDRAPCAMCAALIGEALCPLTREELNVIW